MSDTMDMLNMQNVTIGEKLKKYRLSHLWTLQHMASRSGLSVGTIQKIEAGTVEPHDLSIAKLFRAFPDLGNNNAA
jgi:transcriptional regulator with XRE-family HTH domain